MKRLNKLPFILLKERAPIVDQLIDLVKERDDYILELEREIKRLKKLPQRPKLSPSKLKAGMKGLSAEPKRAGSAKVKKTMDLVITDTQVIKLSEVPEGATFKGYRNYHVQDISLKLVNRLFRCERYRTKQGTYLQAALPEAYRNAHFGPTLRTYIHYQYHHQGVTQPLLLKQLHEWQIQISKGQLNRLINDKNQTFHAEKQKVFETGMALSAYLQTDDTGARHEGRNGYCTYIGNELFAYFKSTPSKSRLNFIECLQGQTLGYRLDSKAFDYLQAYSQGVAFKLLALFNGITTLSDRYFADREALVVYLKQLGIENVKDLQFCSEAAAFSYLKSMTLNNDRLLLSDEAGQFRLPNVGHALCWVHVERKLKQLIPITRDEAQKVTEKLTEYWTLYQDLSAYKLAPSSIRKMDIQCQFAVFCQPVKDYLKLNEVLARIKRWQQRLLLALDYPFLPLHNNTAESDIREYVRRRKINGTTRHALGRAARDTFASLKKTCYKLGINFWKYVEALIFKHPLTPSITDAMIIFANRNHDTLRFALTGAPPIIE